MNSNSATIFLISITFSILISSTLAHLVMAQSENKTSENAAPQYTNNARAIVNLKNHTITLIDTTTNETISVKNFTLNPANTTTTNETIGTQNFPANVGNTTSNQTNLTEKFSELSK